MRTQAERLVEHREPVPQPGGVPQPGATAQSAADCELDEKAALDQARTDPARFAPIYERYFPRIYRYCRRRLDQPEEAEDLTALVFTRALAGLRDYRGGSVAAWLFRIAHNAVANELRARRPQASLDGAAGALVGDLPDRDEPAVAETLREEERHLIAELLARLPEDHRELLALKMAGELTAREIGAVLGKSEGAVRIALHRIVQQLRAAYAEMEEMETGRRP